MSAEAMYAFTSMPEDCDDTLEHSYMGVDASTFHLRVGPNYKKKKTKAPSGSALYELVSMDFIQAETFLKDAKDAIELPSIPGVTDVETGNEFVPPMLVVNSWLPTKDHGPLSNGKLEKPSYICVIVFAIEQWVVEELKDIDNASPAVKLLAEWCREAETNVEFRGRFKAIGLVEEMEKMGIPGFITQYNGKPTLITKSGNFTRHEKYIEMAINVHLWAYVARKGMLTLLPSFAKLLINVGFTIEGRSDMELPEVLLGGCRFIRLDPAKAKVDGVHDHDECNGKEDGNAENVGVADLSINEDLDKKLAAAE
uniref:Protein ENHANCED DISEASE RESISTANCE 2 C-terminal domain-containing protein n=1 Tax=Helicotheca tamesis TaxID=374047 RepID=A0A7S2MX10_9STRA